MNFPRAEQYFSNHPFLLIIVFERLNLIITIIVNQLRLLRGLPFSYKWELILEYLFTIQFLVNFQRVIWIDRFGFLIYHQSSLLKRWQVLRIQVHIVVAKGFFSITAIHYLYLIHRSLKWSFKDLNYYRNLMIWVMWSYLWRYRMFEHRI